MACSAAMGSPLPIRLPSTSTNPDTASDCTRLASRTTRHPMLWPTSIADRDGSSVAIFATAAPYASMVHSAGVPGLDPCPGNSHTMTVVLLSSDSH